MSNTATMMTSADIIADIEGELALRTYDYQREIGRSPKLAMITNLYEGPTQKYMTLKDKIGTGLGFTVESVVMPPSVDPSDMIDHLAQSDTTDGIIVQLPLSNPEDTEAVLEHLPREKDVDGLGPNSVFEPATPSAILRLIEAYVPDDKKELVIIGRGLLVGAPLARIAHDHGFNVSSFDKKSESLAMLDAVNRADIIVSATGVPGLLTPDLFDSLETPRVLVDAGSAERSGSMVGDVSDELRELAIDNNWTLTPSIGGVGPLTIRCLLENTMTAAEQRAGLVNKVSS